MYSIENFKKSTLGVDTRIPLFGKALNAVDEERFWLLLEPVTLPLEPPHRR